MQVSSPVAGKLARLVYSVSRDGKPVRDLEPYLASPLHLAVVDRTLLRFAHLHGELPPFLADAIFDPRDPALQHAHQYLPDRFGPRMDAYVTFPALGEYVLFGEFKRTGKIVVSRFELTVGK